ncbi:hypothetical protein LTR33_007532 [Friedmanniomyces endolithicus]|nr:hypothetical protein LTR33_007532 [Friedmanniomyces endolithicus]
MQPTLPKFITFPGLNRANNVPHWQRLHQSHEDGLRQWQKVGTPPRPRYGHTAPRAKVSWREAYPGVKIMLARSPNQPREQQ